MPELVFDSEADGFLRVVEEGLPVRLPYVELFCVMAGGISWARREMGWEGLEGGSDWKDGFEGWECGIMDRKKRVEMEVLCKRELSIQ